MKSQKEIIREILTGKIKTSILPDGSEDFHPSAYAVVSRFYNLINPEWYPPTKKPLGNGKVLCRRKPRFEGDKDTYWVDWCENFVFREQHISEDDYCPEQSAWTWYGQARHCKDFEWRYLE